MLAAEAPDKAMLAGLHPFASFVGSWKGTGSSEKSSGWKEKADCTWGFREKDGRPSIDFVVEGSQIIKAGRLTYDPATESFKFACKNRKDERMDFAGKAAGGTLKLDRSDADATDHLDRLELKLQRGGDKLIFDFRKKRGKSSFEQYATSELFREGMPDSSAERFEKGPYCVVTGGPGRVSFDHNGRSVTVACEVCKEEFLAHPDRYPAK